MAQTADRELHLVRMKSRASDRCGFQGGGEEGAVRADAVDGGAGDVEDG